MNIIGCGCTLAANIQNIQSAFYERNVCCYCIQPWVSLLLSKSIFRRNPHYAMVIFQVLLFPRSTFCFQFLCSECSLRNNSALFYLPFFWIIITLIILNNFKLFPPKSICVPRLTKITSYEICCCSRHAGINGKR